VTNLEAVDGGGSVIDGRDALVSVVNADHIEATDPAFQGHPIIWRQALAGDPTEFVLPIDWIWSVLDPIGLCSLDAPAGGCRIGGAGDALTDRDGDGLPDVRDLCPDNRPGDFDGDGAIDGPVLTCGENHCDGDNDWTGDECDALPGECDWDSLLSGAVAETTFDRFRERFDRDLDGVSNPLDNCETVGNADQANCNEDAERAAGVIDPALGLVGVGDACDPIPCGDTEVGSRTTSDGILEVSRMDNVLVDPLTTVRQDARTGFRFCACTAAMSDTSDTRVNCQDLQLDLTGECNTSDTETYDELEDEDAIWRDVSIVDYGGLPAAQIVEQPRGAEAVLAYAPRVRRALFDADLNAVWAVEADNTRWREGGFATPVDPVPGVLWTHTPGGPSVSAGFEDAVRQLSSHYWSGPIAEPRVVRPPFPCFDLLGPYLGSAESCPACGGSFPPPFIALPGGGLCGARMPLPDPAVIFPDDLRLAGEVFGPTPPDWLIADSSIGRWISAVEPPTAIRPGGLAHTLVSLDASQVLQPVVLDPSGGYSPTPCNNCGPFLQTTAMDSSAFPPRTGFSATASATRGLVWIAGGVDAAGVELSDLWAIHPPTGRARPILLDGVAGPIVALTYSHVLDALFLLERAPDRMWRLHSLSLREHAQRVEAEWRVHRAERAFELTATPAGAVALTSSRRNDHCIVVLDDTFVRNQVFRGSGVVVPTSLVSRRQGFAYVRYDVEPPRGGPRRNERQTVVGIGPRDLEPFGLPERALCF